MKSEKNFEEAINELENIVTMLEKGDLPLEGTLKKFEQGMHLAQFCQKSLQDAQKKVEQLKNDNNLDE